MDECRAHTKTLQGHKSSQGGFTLLELIIAMVLGLLISAAAIQVFLTSARSFRIQQANSQIQDNVVFGFNQITKHIRRANYGALDGTHKTGSFLNHKTPLGGIVLTAPTLESIKDNAITTNLDGLAINSNLISKDLLSQSGTTESNMAGGLKNDQLTIQYQMPLENEYDCQGRQIPRGFYVIERYFVREEDNKRKSLACASTNYDIDAEVYGSTGTDISKYTNANGKRVNANFDGAGSIIIPNVDYFRVLYGVTRQSNFATNPSTLTMLYLPVTSNLDDTFIEKVGEDDKVKLMDRRITSVQIGIVFSSDSPIKSGVKNSELSFNVLDKRNIKLNAASIRNNQFLKETFDTTVLIRNGRGRE